MKRALLVLLALGLLAGCSTTAKPAAEPTTTTTPAQAVVTPALVKAEPQIYLVGDSITAGGTPGVLPWRDTWAVRAATMICGVGCPQAHIVGHAGQCLVLTICVYETPLLSTVQTEVLDAKPATVLYEIGINDIGNITDTALENGYQQLAQETRAAGARFMVGTITPYNPADYRYWTAAGDQQRQRINTWLKATYGPDVVDFDAALRMSAADDRMNPVYASPDGLHPNPYGALVMADQTRGRF